MGTFSIWHWLIVLAVVLLLFGGGGKIPKLMKDLGAGINQFKRGLKDEEKKADGDASDEPKALDGEQAMNRSGEEENKKAANG